MEAFVGHEVEFNSDPEDTTDPASHLHVGTIADVDNKRNQIKIRLQSDSGMHVYFMDEIEIWPQQTTSNKSNGNKPELLESMNELLVFAYIRAIEQHAAFQQIVPLSIIQMVMKYYYIVGEIKIILSTTTRAQYEFGCNHTLQYIDFKQDKSILFKSRPIAKRTNLKNVCFVENIPVPSYLSDNLSCVFTHKSQSYSAIINDGATMSYFPTIELNNSCQQIMTFETLVPHNTWLRFGNDHDSFYRSSLAEGYREYIYSDSHGLICFDGNILYQLLFDAQHTQSFDGWHWNKLANIATQQNNASLCWIKNYSFESSENDKLFICGGDCKKTANLFAIKDKTCTQLSSMPNARTMCGSYYDIYNKRVYVGGGGHGSAHSVDCYDFNSGEWIMYPDTLFRHSRNPILWMDGYVLFICGHHANIGSVERYDIRSNSNHWSLADKRLQIDKLIIPCAIQRVLSNQT